MLQVLAIFLPSWLTRNLPIKRNQELNAASAYIKQVCRDLIAKKRTVLAEKGVEDVDILSVALGSGGFQDHELVNQMMTFLIAGHETTATAMVSSFFALPFLKQKKSKKKSSSTYQLTPSLTDLVPLPPLQTQIHPNHPPRRNPLSNPLSIQPHHGRPNRLLRLPPSLLHRSPPPLATRQFDFARRRSRHVHSRAIHPARNDDYSRSGGD